MHNSSEHSVISQQIDAGEKPWVTTTQAAKMLNVAHATVVRMCQKNGRSFATRLHDTGHWRVSKAALAMLLESNCDNGKTEIKAA